MTSSIERVQITVDATTYALSPLEGLDDIRAQIMNAVRAGGGFLNVTADGGQRLCFFVTASSSIVVAVSTVSIGQDTADGERRSRDACPILEHGDDELPFDII
ncbi:hypothetical protein SAMN04487848_1629 [Microbacterium sp. ru370.1]|uniref:hypothetical protein n=1 Tax=unclassified Microbacterium TaxID=2609290 RepID=UPI00087E41EF|nr:MULTISPECIES: hypothetical protein [unclassified Microbacterium]SDO59499.1 hypothetical protein SAMN04487848_1629 [Microbacterium sp. ru370.1]SIT86031.1 hypothetical protein SAMN05880579_1626 [Microbacterium sp. RU1D]